MIPAILSLGGTTLPLFILALFAYEGLTQPPSSLDVTFAEEILVFGIVILTAVLPILFSALLFYRPAGHTTWGIVLTGWHSAVTTVVIIFVSELTTYGVMFSPSWVSVIFFTPLLGLAGGVLGIFWKPNSIHNVSANNDKP